MRKLQNILKYGVIPILIFDGCKFELKKIEENN
jgi:hypothetical protein